MTRRGLPLGGMLLAVILPGPAWAIPEESLTLDECMSMALQHNRDVKQARIELERVGGSRIIEKARFLPHLDLLGGYDRSQSNSDSVVLRDKSASIRLSQRIFEFGRDPTSLVNLRQDQRDAFFDLERVAASTLRQVREGFFSILLRQEQLKTRQENLASFQRILERMRKRYEKRESQLADVLTAELSASQEELRINGLERSLNSLRMELMQLLGKPVGGDVQLVGELQGFGLDEDRSVAIALKNSINVAVAREALAEQRRVVAEVKTSYYPDLTVRSGVENKREAFSLDLDRSGSSDVWALDASAEHFFIRPNSRFQRFQGAGYEDVGDDFVWFVNVDLVVPIFRGFERKGELVREKGLLTQRRIDLENQQSLVELSVRQAHQRLQEQLKAVKLQEQALEISKKRLTIIVRLREFGRATEDDVENFRTRAFTEQDRLFSEQDQLIRDQESLRELLRMFRAQ